MPGSRKSVAEAAIPVPIETTQDVITSVPEGKLQSQEEIMSLSKKEIKIEDLYENILGEEKVDKKVERVVTYILQSQTGTKDFLTTSDIKNLYNEFKQAHPEIVSISLNTMGTYVSTIAKRMSCDIRCNGKKQGYYLLTDKSSEKQEPSIEPMVEGKEVSSEEKLWEKHIYPLITAYLSSNEDLEWVVNLADRRKNHEWGNTDILALKLYDYLSSEQFELIAYEVKLSLRSWRKDIFEAVSHSMFSNKTYFTFVRVTDVDAIDPDMIFYAQQFGIGLLALEIDKEDWDSIVNNPQAITEDMFDYHIIVPAPKRQCNQQIQNAFFLKYEIHNIQELRRFGK